MTNDFERVVEAALHGDEARLQTLVAGGADIDEYNTAGHTPLTLAVFRGDREAVELLLRCGADPSRPRRGDVTATPLWHATEDFGLDEIAGVLRRFGANR